MKLPGTKAVLLLLAVGLAVCLASLKLFGANEKDSGRAEEARLENIPHADLGNGHFRNPVLVGPGADNTVVRVGSDYYMIAGGGWPDRLIWHSRDLVNWGPIMPALHNVDLGPWASDLTYYKGKYYIYTTQMDPSRIQLGVPLKKNIVMWSDHIEGPWSDPIDLAVPTLFDPGHVADQQGNRYLYFNKGMLIRLAPDGLSTVGDPKKAYDGWNYPKSWVVSCKCLEAPKLVYREGYYYMVSAEGGGDGPTTGHMSIVARSKSVEGPWENSPYNPLVHTASSNDKWWRQGHGTLIEDSGGKWWFLYTGYENAYVLYGKQSLLLPIEWTDDGWPRVPRGVSPTDVLRKPAGENVGHGMPLSDDFSNASLGIQWLHDSSVKPEESFQVGDGKLVMKAAGSLPGKAAIPLAASMLGVTPVNHSYEAEVEVSIPGTAEAGLLLSSGGGREAGATWAMVSLRKGETFLTSWTQHRDDVESKETHLFLRLRDINYDISAFYSTDGKTWIPFDNASTYVTDGRRLFLYAAGTGEVVFRNFKYHGLD